jgi:hypothetical protein
MSPPASALLSRTGHSSYHSMKEHKFTRAVKESLKLPLGNFSR